MLWINMYTDICLDKPIRRRIMVMWKKIAVRGHLYIKKSLFGLILKLSFAKVQTKHMGHNITHKIWMIVTWLLDRFTNFFFGFQRMPNTRELSIYYIYYLFYRHHRSSFIYMPRHDTGWLQTKPGRLFKTLNKMVLIIEWSFVPISYVVYFSSNVHL